MNKPDALPKGIRNAYWFQAFNTMSFTIVLGPLMILYFKNLGATATILGILASLAPILSILQIPAAFFVERIGYRAFVLKGWTMRSLVILLMAGVAFLPTEFDNHTRLTLMLFLLVAYNAMRGISSCGFLPWISRIVPESLMGRYLSRDQISMGIASVGINAAIAVLLYYVKSPHAFGCFLLFSFISGTTSLLFLRRMPDAPVPDESTREIVPTWKEIIFFPPFLRLIRYSIIINIAMSGGGAFWPAFMKDTFHASDTKVLIIMAATVSVMVASLALFGHQVDRVGSRPILFLAGFIHFFHFIGWLLAGSGITGFTITTVSIQVLTAGIAGSLYNIAVTRLAMGTMPEHGKSHFFAYYSVINNIILGLTPVCWGLILDYFKTWEMIHGEWRFTRYSILYVSIALTCLLALLFLKKVKEPKAMPLDIYLHELFVESPRKVLSQIFPRWLS